MARLKILIVDDERDFIELISTRIQEWGYEIIQAIGGQEALDLLKDKKPDIVILDYMMPNMDGIEVLKQIRKTNIDIPVIMFTAYPDTKVQERSAKLNVDAFIPKLSAYQDVHEILKSALNIIQRNLESAK